MRVRLVSHAGLALATVLGTVGAWTLVVPQFRGFAPSGSGGDFINRVALVAAARDTWRATRAIPISTDGIYPGIEYPYFLFES